MIDYDLAVIEKYQEIVWIGRRQKWIYIKRGCGMTIFNFTRNFRLYQV